jgi:hypothetical protein
MRFETKLQSSPFQRVVAVFGKPVCQPIKAFLQ